MPLLRDLFEALRPGQWTKNAVVAAAFFFALGDHDQTLRIADAAWRTAAAVALFCAISSGIYLFNDIRDRDADRAHPEKRGRPIASGRLPVAAAGILSVALLAAGLCGAARLSAGFAAIACAYVGLQLLYSLGLKRVAPLDIILIAVGFALRALSGALALPVTVSPWLLLCAFLLALFLALGKRKHELLTSNASHRVALSGYRASHLQVALWILALGTAAAYAGYTLDAETAQRFHTHLLPWTVPFPLLGLWRFSQLLDRVDTAHSPTERMLRDPIFVLNLLAWAGTTLALIYGAPTGGA